MFEIVKEILYFFPTNKFLPNCIGNWMQKKFIFLIFLYLVVVFFFLLSLPSRTLFCLFQEFWKQNSERKMFWVSSSITLLLTRAFSHCWWCAIKGLSLVSLSGRPVSLYKAATYLLISLQPYSQIDSRLSGYYYYYYTYRCIRVCLLSS